MWLYSFAISQGRRSRENVMSKLNINTSLVVAMVVVPILGVLRAVSRSSPGSSPEYTFLVASAFFATPATARQAQIGKPRYLRDHWRGHVQPAKASS